MENKRFIELKKVPIILSILFLVIFFLLLMKFFNKEAEISSFNLKDIYQKYSLYLPVIFWILSLILFYILLLIKFILRLNFLVVTVLLYFIIYWFFLFFWIDLMFFEVRDADFAKAIIESFSMPLIISSSIILLLVILMSFKKVNSKN